MAEEEPAGIKPVYLPLLLFVLIILAFIVDLFMTFFFKLSNALGSADTGTTLGSILHNASTMINNVLATFSGAAATIFAIFGVALFVGVVVYAANTLRER